MQPIMNATKRFSTLGLALVLAGLVLLPVLAAESPAPAANAPAGFTPLDPFAQVKKMGRGVNIIGYDPIWRNFANARFKERHFQRIHDGGFQTVRVNLQAFSHMNAQNQLSPAWFTTMDWVIKNSLANSLTVIIDEHDYSPMGNNAAANKPRLLAFWQQVAERYKDQPNGVVFEILNEPNGQLDVAAWNALLKECLAVIRQTNPARNVIIGPASWNSVDLVDRLELPAEDLHLIATVHYYKPMEFTHQGARWNAATANLSGVTWGTEEEKKAVQADFAKVQDWSRSHQRPVLLGEFGAYDRGDIDSRVKYTAYVARTAEALGWAWTYWQFDSDFIVYDIGKDDWVAPILKALVP
jgi:endoglucanase